MSVQCNTYIMLGTLVPYSTFCDRRDEIEPYLDSAFKGIHHHNGICVLSDGMNRGYVALGRVLDKTPNWGGFDGVIEIRPLMPPADEIVLIEKEIEKLVGEPLDQKIRVFVISHRR